MSAGIVDDDAIPDNWRHMIVPESWAEQVHDTSDEFFGHSVSLMDSETHLLAAIEREAQREDVRRDRLGKLNEHLAEVRQR